MLERSLGTDLDSLGHTDFMRKSSSNKVLYDLNKLAAFIVDVVTNEETRPVENDGKNPAALSLWRLGGAKGGAARAKALTPERCREIAKKAVAARWAQQVESKHSV